MGDGEAAAGLSRPFASLRLLEEEGVRVAMEAEEIAADEKQARLPERADIEVRRGALVELPQIAHGDGRTVLDGKGYELHAGEEIAFVRSAARRGDDRFAAKQELDATVDRQLHHVGEAQPVRDAGRVVGEEETGLELQIASGRERRGSRDGRAPRVRLGRFVLRVCAAGDAGGRERNENRGQKNIAHAWTDLRARAFDKDSDAEPVRTYGDLRRGRGSPASRARRRPLRPGPPRRSSTGR